MELQILSCTILVYDILSIVDDSYINARINNYDWPLRKIKCVPLNVGGN